jgi:hypothetical protein
MCNAAAVRYTSGVRVRIIRAAWRPIDIRRAIMFKSGLTSSILLLALAAGGCATPAAESAIAGGCATVFGAEVCTWATMSGPTVAEVGATVPLAAIENAPAEMPMVWPPVPVATLALPEPASRQTGITHLAVDWEAGGHPPAPFLTPHFDFHFYSLPESEVDAIDCADTRKPAALPAGYGLPDIALPPHMAEMMQVSTLVGLCVPKMGMHAMPRTDLERQDTFDGTMVIGYYKEAPIFVEPMVSKAMLMRRQSFELPTPVVPGASGPQPTRFRAEYDPATQAYRLTLSGFTR